MTVLRGCDTIAGVAAFTTSDGVDIRYETVGHGPRVYALQGGPANDYRYLEEDLAALTSDFEIVFHDYRGSGESASAPPDTYTLQKFADDLDELRGALGDERIRVLGHSMGGFIAQLYALQHADRCDCVVLAGTSPTSVPRKIFPPTLRALGWARTTKMAARALWWPVAYGWRPKSQEARRRAYAIWSTMQEGRPEVRADVTAREVRLGLPMDNDNIRPLQRTFSSHDMVDRLGEIKCPALVLYGSRDAMMVAAAKWFSTGLPNATVCCLPDIGHELFFEAGEAALEPVRKFLSA